MRSSSSSYNHPSSPQKYLPSVPLSVYRELAAQLQATQETIDVLDAQNQQLAQQNQQLHQEIEKVVQHVLHLQQVVDANLGQRVDVYPAERGCQSKPKRSVSGSRLPHQSASTAAKTSSKHQTEFMAVEEVEVDNYRRRSQPASASQISGWGLATATLIVIVIAFTTGFLLVRPLSSHR